MAFLSDLISDIDQSFKSVLPKHFCVPCFVKGVLEGVAVGALTIAGLAAVAAVSPFAATAAAVALAVLGVAGAVYLVASWRGMSDGQKSEALGSVIGGVAVGGMASAMRSGAPGAATVTTEETAALERAITGTAAIENAETSVVSLAAKLRAEAIAAEPKITTDMISTEQSTGGRFVGLENRVKTAESLTRKLTTDALLDDVSVEEAGKDIGDALRYTKVYDSSEIATGANRTFSSLEQMGYKKLQVKNSFSPDQPYKGINSVFESPEGQKFELQFHTPESHEVKQLNHGLYEEQRLLETPPAHAVQLDKQMVENASKVPEPPGIEKVINFP